MRLLWEIFTLIAALGVLFAIAKGFPQFGQALRLLFLHPFGWVCMIGLFVWITVIRSRRAASQGQDPS